MGHLRRVSRSRLYDRVVRVDRNRPVDDGLGGAVDSYTTIIPSYCVTIYPPQHQERRRAELGQQPLGATHFATADPSLNGKTIMIGDRFVDEENNQSWDVLAVERPQAHVYAAVHRFVLRLVTDEGRVES